MKIVINLKETTAVKLLELAIDKGVNFETIAGRLLEEKVTQLKRYERHTNKKTVEQTKVQSNHDTMAKLLVKRAKKLPVGTTFTVRSILEDVWDGLVSPKSFGWTAARVLIESGYVEKSQVGGVCKYIRI